MTINGLYKYVKDRLSCLLCKINAIENGTIATDGNGIYSGDGDVANARTVNLLGLMNILGAGAGRELYIEIGDGVTNLSSFNMTNAFLQLGFQNGAIDSTILFDNTGINIRAFLNLLQYTPSGVGDTAGVPGSMCWDASFLYVKTANHVWERVALTPIP